jgi:lysophospholipase L1-like esterase
MKILLILIFSLVGITLIIESGLRLFLGFGNPPLYIRDKEIGYLLAPNQETRRLRNLIQINQYSMRSQEITPKKPQNTLRIFLLGDSIVNGNWWTDQKNILSALIERQLKPNSTQNSTQNSTVDRVEVFNASANSWNPRNELAYVRRFGLFEADLLILVINTDDLFGTAPSSAIVGQDPSYPDRKLPLALIELYERYFQKAQPIAELEQIKQEKGDRVGLNLEAIAQIKAIVDNHDTRFILAFTPLLRELEKGSKNYEQKARNRVLELVKEQNLTYLDFLPIFSDFPQPKLLYRDHIHLSPQGEAIVSETIVKAIQTSLEK